MKTIILASIGMAFMLISCDQTLVPLAPLSAAMSQDGIPYTLQATGDQMILLRDQYQAQSDIVILKGRDFGSFQESWSVSQIKTLVDGLEVSLTDGRKIRISIGDPNAQYLGNSLIVVSGSAYENRFYSNGRPIAKPDVAEISCHCKANGTVASCSNGGAGSSECSIDTYYTAPGGNQYDQKCSVKCAAGYYSCCNK